MHSADPTYNEIPNRLPMLDAYVAEHFGDERPLRGTTAVLIQHQLGSQVAMTRTLIQLGIDPSDLYWIDIPYTSNVKVHAALLELGIPERNFSSSNYRLDDVYAAYQRKRVQERFAELTARLSPEQRLLVLDDGSYFLEAMACYRPRGSRIAIVEQTTRGMIKIRKDATLRHYANSVPLINVAESTPKKELESPHIGEAVCKSLLDRISRRDRLGPSDQVLILGFGSIGQNVARSLEALFDVDPARIHVCDLDPKTHQAVAERRYNFWQRDQEQLVCFKLVIGCSGTTSFGIGDRIFLEHGAYLVSASSGAAELSREEFIDMADAHPSDHIHIVAKPAPTVHDDIEIKLVDRTAVFANGGFPVNFDGRVNCVHPKYIQATHTLQVGAACQAVGTDLPKGINPLDSGVCDWVTKNFDRMIGRWDAPH